MERYFQISCHLLIGSAFVALALTGRLDIPSVVFFALSWMWSFRRTLQDRLPLVSSKGAFYLSGAYIVFFIVDWVILSRSFIPATIHLVLFLEVVKLFQEKTDRDYFYLILLAFMMILAASSLTIDISFVLALLIFLVALVSTLMSFDMYRCNRSSPRRAVTPPEMSRPLGGMSMWATVWIVAFGVVLFFVIPRTNAQYFSRAASPALLLSGFSDTVQLGEIGQVKLSSAVVMRARHAEGNPNGLLHWRGVTLDTFDGTTWYRSDRLRTSRIPRGGDQTYIFGPVQGTGERVRYSILLEPVATTSLFAPFELKVIDGVFPGGLERDNDGSAYLRFQTLRRSRYDAISEVPLRPREAELVTPEPQIPPAILAQFLQVPDDLDPRIRELAREVTAAGRHTIEKASLVEAHLKRDYEYSLNLTWDPGPQPVATFLFSAKVGHCEYFASSMALMLRSVGIPTRMVNGFLMGEYNPVGDDYIVRQSDAHSWVEVYVPGHGWIEFDPTPPDPNQREAGLLQTVMHYVDAVEMFWNTYVLIFDSGLQTQLFQSTQDSLRNRMTEVRSTSERLVQRGQDFADAVAMRTRSIIFSPTFLAALLLTVIGVATLVYRKQIAVQIAIWRLRREGGEPDDDVVAAMFYRAARLVERRTSPRRAGQTWREWIDTNAPAAPGLRRALDVFEKSHYGGVQISADEFGALDAALSEVQRIPANPG